LNSVLQTTLKAIGVPALAWLLGANWQSLGEYAKTHPWRILGLLSFYEAAAVFIGGFVRDVWQRIRSHFLVEFCANRIQLAVQSGFSRYESQPAQTGAH
jgi:hypothetical protein